MEYLERGRLYPIKADGSEMAPFIIKKRVLYIGSGDSCGIRLYTDGIFPEHCTIKTGKKGKVYFEPLHPTALALVNHMKIDKKCLLKQDDVITILMRSFRFAYPVDSMHGQTSVGLTNLPKRKISAARKSVSPKKKVNSNVDDNLHILRVKRPATGMGVEETSTKRKKLSISDKKVRFGPPLTPEEFDKHLPPSSPLRRGSLPGEKRLKKDEQNVVKRRFSCHFSPNALKRRKASAKTKSLSPDPQRNSLPSQSTKRSRGSPLVDKSLNIANECSSTFIVNAEVHSGPKTKVNAPVKNRQSSKQSISFSSIESEDFSNISHLPVPLDDLAKNVEANISRKTPSKMTSNQSISQSNEGSDISSISMPGGNITKVCQSPGSKRTSSKSGKSMVSVPLDDIISFCHSPVSKRTPSKSSKSGSHKKPLFSDILKKNSNKASIFSREKSPKLTKCMKKTSKHQGDHHKSSEMLIHRQILSVGSTGHANSPDTIILRKRKLDEMDISDLVNVKLSPRTPRRARYDILKRKKTEKTEDLQAESFEEVLENFEKPVTPTQQRKGRKSNTQIIKEQNSQTDGEITEKTENLQAEVFDKIKDNFVKPMTPAQQKNGRKSSMEQDSQTNIQKSKTERDFITLPLQQSEQADVEEIENKGEKITTPSRKTRKSGEFVLETSSSVATRKSLEKMEDLEPQSFEKMGDNFVKPVTKGTPTQQRKGRKSNTQIIKEQNSQTDGEITEKTENLQAEVFEKIKDNFAKPMTQQKNGSKSGTEQDSQTNIQKSKTERDFITMPLQQSEQADVEEIENKSEKITTPSRKTRKSGEFVLETSSSVATRKNLEKMEDLEPQSFEKMGDNFVKPVTKGTPPQQRKVRKFNSQIVKEKDSQTEDLCNIEKREMTEKTEDLQAETFEKMEDHFIKPATPIQQTKSRKSSNQIVKEEDSQTNIQKSDIERDNITLPLQQSEQANDEEIEKKSEEIIRTPSRKTRKSGEFLLETSSSVATREMSEKNKDLKPGSFEMLDNFVSKVSPTQQRKGRKSNSQIVEENSQTDDLCNIEKSEIIRDVNTLLPLQSEQADVKEVESIKIGRTTSKKARKSEEFVPEARSSPCTRGMSKKNKDLESGPFEKILDKMVKPITKVTAIQQRKGKKSDSQIVKEQDSQTDDLGNIEKTGDLGRETVKKSQSISTKVSEKESDVKETIKKVNKQTKKGRKPLQVSKENDECSVVVTHENSHTTPVQKENEVVKELQLSIKNPRKGRKLLQISAKTDLSENTSIINSPLMPSPVNKQEKKEKNEKKIVKESKNKRKKENETPLAENLSDPDKNHGKKADIKSKRVKEASLQNGDKEVKEDTKTIDKPLSKRRNVKKDSKEVVKSSAQELSPCRRVTRAMARKCAPK